MGIVKSMHEDGSVEEDEEAGNCANCVANFLSYVIRR